VPGGLEPENPVIVRLLVVALLALAVPAWGAEGASAVVDNSPEGVTRQYFDAIRTGGVTAAVRFMHPDALARFQEMLVPLFAAEAEAGHSELRDATFGSEATLEQVTAKTPEQFMGGFAALMDRQVGQIEFTDLQVIGSVPEGDETVHVLARIGVGMPDSEDEIEGMEVVTLIRWQDSWRLGLTKQMQGLADALRVQMSKAAAHPAP
jgi:hypothetical protein